MGYVVIDTKREKYWKKNNYGYTTDIAEARIFTKEEAEKKVNAIGVNDLIMKPFMRQFVATFGQGQPNEGKYILINTSCYGIALAYMDENYRGKYCNVYTKNDWDNWVKDANFLGVRVETMLKEVTVG